MFGVHEVGRGNNDRVEVLFLIEHLLVVLIGVVLVPVLSQASGAVVAVVGPDVTNRLEADAGYLQAIHH